MTRDPYTGLPDVPELGDDPRRQRAGQQQFIIHTPPRRDGTRQERARARAIARRQQRAGSPKNRSNYR